MTDQTITSVSRESRIFKPSAEFKNQANLGSFATYRRLYAESVNAPEKFWAKQAKEHLVWRKPFKQVLDWKPPHAKWFLGGKLNISENCLDRHLGTARENKAAIIFEGEPGDVRTITYKQLRFHVCRLAHVFENMGIQAGDRIAIYMPMVPEAVFAMLACARIGAVHTVVFGGFSPEALKDRLNDCKARMVIIGAKPQSVFKDDPSFTIDPGYFLHRGLELHSSRYVNAAEIAQTLELVRLKRITPVVTQTFTLDRVEEAHDLIRRNATAGRLALEIGD